MILKEFLCITGDPVLVNKGSQVMHSYRRDTTTTVLKPYIVPLVTLSIVSVVSTCIVIFCQGTFSFEDIRDEIIYIGNFQ